MDIEKIHKLLTTGTPEDAYIGLTILESSGKLQEFTETYITDTYDDSGPAMRYNINPNIAQCFYIQSGEKYYYISSDMVSIDNKEQSLMWGYEIKYKI